MKAKSLKKPSDEEKIRLKKSKSAKRNRSYSSDSSDSGRKKPRKSKKLKKKPRKRPRQVSISPTSSSYSSDYSVSSCSTCEKRTLDGKYIPDHSKLANIGDFHIPSATELQLSQTVFEKVEGDSIDMSYSDNRRLSGVLQLTPSYLSHHHTKRYKSLIRFEDYYFDICGVPFTAYVACMSCLLKIEADVRVLRANGIIPSTSFDDKDVLRCVQELRTLIAHNLQMPNELIILEEKVMAHHKKSVYRVIGEFQKRYCSDTWVIISVIAGILLFVLTFIQTIYGTLSYYQQ